MGHGGSYRLILMRRLATPKFVYIGVLLAVFEKDSWLCYYHVASVVM
jgi:hypothetical protein